MICNVCDDIQYKYFVLVFFHQLGFGTNHRSTETKF